MINTAGGKCPGLGEDLAPVGVKRAADREYMELIKVCGDCARVCFNDSGKVSIAGGSA